MDGTNPAHGAMFGPDEMENPNDTPTVAEYKKLKRVMRIMIKFYEDGSNAKLDQANDMEYELQKVDTDMHMAEKQLQVLRTFPIHPKRSAYEKELAEEVEKLKKVHADFTSKLADFKALYNWSLGIVDVTKWLAAGLDDYCVNFLKMELDIVPKPLERPTKETFDKYKQGLEEVHTNLHESQDFFQASLDGRLKKYHTMEKEIIEGQLKALEEFPPMNPRKAHWEEELQKDLEFVKENMTENPESNKKRERMLTMHRDFVNTLTWFKSRLDTFAKELGIEVKENGTAHTIPSTSDKVAFVTKMESQ